MYTFITVALLLEPLCHVSMNKINYNYLKSMRLKPIRQQLITNNIPTLKELQYY